MEQMPLFEELRDSPSKLFQWPDDQKNRRQRIFTAGKILFHQGSKPDQIYEVVTGTLKLSRVTENGGHIILGFPTSGAIIGLGNLKEYQYTAETLTPAKLLSTRHLVFQKDVLQNMSSGKKLMQWIDWQEDIALSHISVLAMHHPVSRIAAFLLKFVQQQGAHGDPVEIQLPMTQRDIAGYLAIAPETYSRIMKKLRENGILRSKGHGRNGNQIEIMDMGRLARFADGETFSVTRGDQSK
jgi:CRP/FNR family transcriptional regulator, anaerobic regulatory protein